MSYIDIHSAENATQQKIFQWLLIRKGHSSLFKPVLVVESWPFFQDATHNLYIIMMFLTCTFQLLSFHLQKVDFNCLDLFSLLVNLQVQTSFSYYLLRKYKFILSKNNSYKWLPCGNIPFYGVQVVLHVHSSSLVLKLLRC